MTKSETAAGDAQKSDQAINGDKRNAATPPNKPDTLHIGNGSHSSPKCAFFKHSLITVIRRSIVLSFSTTFKKYAAIIRENTMSMLKRLKTSTKPTCFYCNLLGLWWEGLAHYVQHLRLRQLLSELLTEAPIMKADARF